MDAKQLSGKIRRLPKFLEGALQRGLQDFGTEAVDMNIAQMEKEGEDSDGRKFGDYSVTSYDIGYPQMKNAEGLEGGFINLHLTGDFHSSMDFRVSKKGLEIFTTDEDNPKVRTLIKWYGDEIFGLNDKNFDLMFDDITEHIAKELTSYFT